jgi:hypothetical protein
VRKFFVVAFFAIVGASVIACGTSAATKISDKDLRVWRNTLSPKGGSRIVIYQHDTGALGYGRVFWAVTPADIENIDLANFKLPDGYRAEGWTRDGDLQVSKWQPYYGIRDKRTLNEGDSFNGQTVRLVPNDSKYELPGYQEPTQ